MKTITKSLVGTVAAGAMAMASASPAMAQRGHDRHDRDGISAGEVIAGALVIGGIAAIAASAGRDRDRYDRDYDRYDRGYGARDAVEQCVYAAERQASRHSWGGRADVTDIRDVDRTRNGYTVKGRIAVNTNNRGWRNGDNRYGRGWGSDYRGWNNNLRGYDSGKFTCKVNYNGRTSIDFSGIRGL